MLYLHGIGHFHPDNVIDNAFLEALDIDTTSEWIVSRVGITSRRTVLPLDYIKRTKNKQPLEAKSAAVYSGAKMAAIAFDLALQRANLKASDIGLVIAGGCSPDYALPATASVVAAEAGIEAECFDVNTACSSFAAQLHLISRMKPEELPDYILVAIPETWTTTVDYSDRTSAVLVGDCAIAAIVSPRIKSAYEISCTTLSSNPKGWDKVQTPFGGHFQQQGRLVQKFAIKKTVALIEEIRDKAKIDSGDHYFIGHQANLVMLDSVCGKTAVAEDKHLYNVDQYGNCGAASAPSVLSQNWQTFQSGDNIIIAVVGAGLTWGGLCIKVGKV